MMNYVFDSSFVTALIIPDEKNHQVDKMYSRVRNEDERFIPCLFWFEITNVLKNLIRRGRFTTAEVMQFYPRLDAISFACDHAAGSDYSKKLLNLCNEYNLSSYDAAYLELAERKNAILCTLDDSLRTAAKKYGVAMLK